VVEELLVGFFASSAAASRGVALEEAPSACKGRVLCNASRRSARAVTSSKHQKHTASANHPNPTYNHQPNVRAGYS
jgi:hypothetical protein